MQVVLAPDRWVGEELVTPSKKTTRRNDTNPSPKAAAEISFEWQRYCHPPGYAARAASAIRFIQIPTGGSMGAGFAVIDLETTGLFPEKHDRIVEIGIVHVSPSGDITGQWSTVVNPRRDMGPQTIHGITAA